MEPQNGKRGWSLERYVWNPETGMARFGYERGDEPERVTVTREQPLYFTARKDGE